MDNIKQKIIDYYKPELVDVSRLLKIGELNVGGKKKTIRLGDKSTLYLTFGQGASSPQEAIEKGAYVTTPHDLYVLLFPEEAAKHIHKYEDARTDKYLASVEKSIGLTDIKHGYDEEQTAVMDRYKIKANEIEVGQRKDGVWVAQFSQRTDIDDYDITRMFFERKPSRQDILTALLIEDIRFYFSLKGYDKVRFNCWECGQENHWLDFTGGLEEKWNAFKDRYCGC